MTMMPIKFPPGVVQDGTEYSGKGRWRDANLIRWVNNFMRPVGGWVTIDTFTATEPLRNVISWRDNSNTVWTAYASADKLYVVDEEFNEYDITPSTLSFNPGGIVGYGSGTYGSGVYGVTLPPAQTISEDDLWILDTWGENLVALHTGDGRLFQWDPNSPATEAAQVTDAPIGAKFMLVTNERHVMLFGVDSNHATYKDPRGVIWCSRENIVDWDVASSTNTAGEFLLQTQGRIISACKVPGGIFVTTAEDAHLISFVGGSFIYSRNLAAPHCGGVSAMSLIPIPNGAVWVGKSNFWLYTGTVTKLKCDVLDWFFREGDLNRPINIFGGLNEEFREVWFFRPSKTSDEPDEYALWSFRDQQYWSKGELSRHGMSQAIVGNKPIMLHNQTAYKHEFEWTDDGSTRNVWAQSGVLELGNGDQVMHARRFYQDTDAPHPEDHLPYTVSFTVKKSPMDPNPVTKGPYTMQVARGYTDIRFRGRQATMTISQIHDEYWSMGTMRLDVIAGGRR